MRFVAICVAAVIAVGALAGPAAANPPDRVMQTIVVDEPQVWGECPNGLLVLQTYTIHRTLTTYTDVSDNVVRVVRHAAIAETLYTAGLSRSVEADARVHVVDDYIKGIHTVSGQRLIVHLPGPDARVAGHAVFDLDTGELLRETGRIAVDEQVCGYLYG